MIDFVFAEDHKTVLIKKKYSFDKPLMDLFKTICETASARYKSDFKEFGCGLPAVPEVFEGLVNAGFKCYMEDVVKETLLKQAKVALEDFEETRKRLVKIEKKLKEKDLRLFPYQRAGIMWMAPRNRALLGDDMGLGKSAQTLISLPPNLPYLVVCPKAAKSVWYEECKKWRPDIKAYIFQGRGLFTWPRPGEMYIYNWDILPGSAPPNCPDKLILIGDEFHYAKNVDAKRTQFWRNIKDSVLYNRVEVLDKATNQKKYLLKYRSTAGKVYGTTGTPMLNRPSELWTVLNNLDLAEEAFGSWQNFVKIFNGFSEGRKFVWGKPLPEAPMLLRRVMLRREKDDVLKELPAKIPPQDIKVNLEDKKLYKELNALVEEMEEEGISLETATLEEIQSKKIVFENMARLRRLLATAKIPDMLEIVEDHEENEKKLVVFSAHRAPVDTLATREGWVSITGDTSEGDRAQIIKDFQAGKYKGLAATIASVGVAITLTAAHHCLFVDLAWTPAANDQASDRLRRIGQTEKVWIKRLVCNHPLELRVHELLTHKDMLITHSVKASKVTQEEIENYNDKTILTQSSGLEKIVFAEARPKEELKIVGGMLRLNQIMAKNDKIVNPPEIKKPLIHPANNPVESWVEKALVQLSDNNQDRASKKNNVGFNRFDTAIGMDFAEQLRKNNGQLTDKQWNAAYRICLKYKGQVGEPPA